MTLNGQGFVACLTFGLSFLGKRMLNIGASLGLGASYFDQEKLFIYGSLNLGLRF